MNNGRITIATVALAVFAGACAGSGAIGIDDAWARTSAGMQDAGVVYMTVTGGAESDRLVGVSVDPSVAAKAQLHETVATEDDSGNEMMMMQELTALPIPPDETVTLEPGGYHIMLMNLAEPLTDGSTFDITLTFENAGAVDVTVEVRDG